MNRIDTWQATPPRTPGFWLMKCMETDHQAVTIQVSEINGELIAEDPAVGHTQVDILHNGLTTAKWSKIEAAA